MFYICYCSMVIRFKALEAYTNKKWQASKAKVKGTKYKRVNLFIANIKRCDSFIGTRTWYEEKGRWHVEQNNQKNMKKKGFFLGEDEEEATTKRENEEERVWNWQKEKWARTRISMLSYKLPTSMCSLSSVNFSSSSLSLVIPLRLFFLRKTNKKTVMLSLFQISNLRFALFG